MRASILIAVLLASCSVGGQPGRDGGSGSSNTYVDAGSSPDAGSPVTTGCSSDTDCPGQVCNAATGQCQASLCAPTCADWQTCQLRACVPSPGRCASDADCPATVPLCDGSHTCTAPTLTAKASLSYDALIVTNAAYAPGFEQLALLHTLTGVPTRVETIEDICAATPGGCDDSDPCNDTPKAIKTYLEAQHLAGVTQVVLGGDATIVPSRSTSDAFSNALVGADYQETFLSDDYYGDFSEWDTNHDCVYGDPTTDTPAYSPVVGITRVSVSSQDELQTYIAKATQYLTAYDTSRIATALFLSNIATTLSVPLVGDVPVDSAFYFEAPGRTLSILPTDWDITKLYSDSTFSTAAGAQQLTVPAEQAALEAGSSLVVHSGHGDEWDLTVEQDGSNEFSGDMAYALTNTQYPIMVSCACEAATFADGDRCAGQQYITAPAGGGVGYLGNSTIGLGIAGGMQLLDGFLRKAFSGGQVLAGEAVQAAHANLPTSDAISIPVPIIGTYQASVIDADSWRWTQKAATYLGDGLLPVYTDPTLIPAPTFTVSRQAIGNFSQVTFTPSFAVEGTLEVAVGSDIYELDLDASGAPVVLTVAGAPSSVTYGFSSLSTLDDYATASLN